MENTPIIRPVDNPTNHAGMSTLVVLLIANNTTPQAIAIVSLYIIGCIIAFVFIKSPSLFEYFFLFFSININSYNNYSFIIL